MSGGAERRGTATSAAPTRGATRAADRGRTRGVDLLLVGSVYLDMVFADLGTAPMPGHEIKTTSLGISPGGVANIAVAAARLGLSVRLVTALGEDALGDYLWTTLAAEGIDLHGTLRPPDWATPVTVSFVYNSDRSMVTSERTPPPLSAAALDTEERPVRAVFATLVPDLPEWIDVARARGAIVFADRGWDESEQWSEQDLASLDRVDVFLPNRIEAMSYTRAASPEEAALRLVERVPLIVVKCGAEGAVACRRSDLAPAWVPAIDVPVLDPTGAGDVFDAAFIVGTLSGWTLEQILEFSNLCAGLSVSYHGGSLSAPTLGDVARWLAADPLRSQRYRFLESHIRDHLECATPPRAQPTLPLRPSNTVLS